MVLQSSGQVSLSNMRAEYGIVGTISYSNLRNLDRRVPQSSQISFNNFYGLYKYPTDSNVLFLEASNALSYPGTGNTWFDLSGLSNNFTIPSGISWSNAGYFAASSNHIGIVGPSNNAFSIDTEHTIECVVRGRTGMVQNTFFYFESTAATGSQRMILSHLPWSDGNTYYDVRGCCAASQRLSYVEPSPNTAIRHYVFRCRTTTTPNRNVFINGTSIANSGSNSTSTAYAFGGPTRLLNHFLGNSPWSGDVYYFRIYNRGLSDTEISDLYTTMKTKYGI